MGYDIDERQIRTHYALLRHQGFFTVVHCQNPTTGRMVDRQIVKGVDQVVAFARSNNGLGNVFIGRNPRKDETGKTIGALTCFSLDIDPERPKGTAATEAQRQQARRAAEKILAVAPGGALLDSGNGYQIFYTWVPVAREEAFYESFAKKAATWTDSLRPLLAESGCVLDSIHDNERLVKLAGTVSVKGAPDQWRTARFVSAAGPNPLASLVFRRITETPCDTPGVVLSTQVSERPFEDEVVVAARALSRLAPGRGDDYHDWLKVGMCLRGLGDAGLALWDNWSKRRQGYEAGACEAKWQTFEPASVGEGLTVGSLVHWAEKDSAKGALPGEVLSPRGEVEEPTHLSSSESYLLRLPERMVGRGEEIELPTQLPELDAFGPLIVRQHILTIGARTNIGKTAMAITLSASVAKGMKRVLFFSTETSADELWDRLVLALNGGPAEDRLEAAKRALDKLDFHICDGFEPSVVSVDRLVDKLRPDVFLFDHIQHAGSDTDHRAQELSRFARGLHDVARRYNAAAIITSQLNRSAEHEEPALRHLKECGTIEEESRAVLLMKRLSPDLTATTFPVAVTLAKNKGKMGTAQLLMKTAASRFETLTQGGAA